MRVARRGAVPVPSYVRMTFRRGCINGARFAPDGQSYVYSAAWDGAPSQLFSGRVGHGESSPLDLPSGIVLAISRSGELAVLLRPQVSDQMLQFVGTLARCPLSGGKPREVLENVTAADWSPDGTQLAVVRYTPGHQTVEYPPGHVLYRSTGWIDPVRIAPRGDRVAFVDHPDNGSDNGTVIVLDVGGKRRVASPAWAAVRGIAWAPAGDAVWLSATSEGEDRALRLMTMEGATRVVARTAGSLTLMDLSPQGRALTTIGDERVTTEALTAGAAGVRDFSVYVYSVGTGISRDGSQLLIDETSGAAGPQGAAFLRPSDGSPPTRLGDGAPMRFSPDERWVLTAVWPKYVLMPVGPGESRVLDTGRVRIVGWGNWALGGAAVIYPGEMPGRPPRMYLQPAAGGPPRPITPEGVIDYNNISSAIVQQDGRAVLIRGADSTFAIYPIQGGAPRAVLGLKPGEMPIQFTVDDRELYVCGAIRTPTCQLFRLDVATGQRQQWKVITPPDPAGIMDMTAMRITPDGRYYEYSVLRQLSTLYVVEGAR